MNQQRTLRGRSNLATTMNDNNDGQIMSASASFIPLNEEMFASTIQSNYSDIQINRESIIFIWLDLKILSTSIFIGALRAINHTVRTYTDVLTCLNESKTFKEKIFFISSSSNEELIAAMNNIDNIEAIFVLHSDINSIKGNYHKLLGIFTQQEELIRILKETLDKFQQIQLERFIFEQDNIFLWLQLWKEELTNRKIPTNNKSDFVEMARDYYRSNPRRIRIIDEFDRTYRPKETLHWCVDKPFPSYLLQHAFIFCQPEELNFCRFLIADASRLIQQQSKRTGSLQLYRGMKLPSKLLESFEMHTGKIMCACGFFTCTKSRTIALELVSSSGYRSDLSSVLFKIDCDASVKLVEVSTENRSSIVIFDVGTTFHIIYINRGTTSIIKLKAVPDEGKKMAREYKDNHKGETIKTMLDQLLTSPKQRLSPSSKQSSSPLSEFIHSSSLSSQNIDR
ncbi:unnamed protein product [Rotaria sp. Silwood2]|nr:unnamed protein product [Rotaria sp. Silwood2]